MSRLVIAFFFFPMIHPHVLATTIEIIVYISVEDVGEKPNDDTF